MEVGEMRVGDIVFEKARYSSEPSMFAGPVLITNEYPNGSIDICYLNNPHTNEPQGLSRIWKRDFMPMDRVPEVWREHLSYWATRALCSSDPNLTMTYEAGQNILSELERVGAA
jgi:hypothetical protein